MLLTQNKSTQTEMNNSNSKMVKQKIAYLSDLKNSRFAVHANYNEDLHSLIKTVEKRIWNPDYLYWSMPMTSKDDFIEALEKLGYQIIKSEITPPSCCDNTAIIKCVRRRIETHESYINEPGLHQSYIKESELGTREMRNALSYQFKSELGLHNFSLSIINFRGELSNLFFVLAMATHNRMTFIPELNVFCIHEFFIGAVISVLNDFQFHLHTGDTIYSDGPLSIEWFDMDDEDAKYFKLKEPMMYERIQALTKTKEGLATIYHETDVTPSQILYKDEIGFQKTGYRKPAIYLSDTSEEACTRPKRMTKRQKLNE